MTAAADRSKFSKFRSHVAHATLQVAAAAYVGVVFVSPPPSWDHFVWRFLMKERRALVDRLDAGLASVGWGSNHPEPAWAVYLVLVGIVFPWTIMLVLRRGRAGDVGLRIPNRLAWRVVAVGFLLSLPSLLWMSRGPTFAAYYRPQLARTGMGVFLGYYLANLASEHFFFHGVLLGWGRRAHRWPAAPAVVEDARGFRRLWQWFGMAQPTEDATGLTVVMRWLGLPSGCVFALFLSATLFGLIHVGKDVREAILSFPGGLALAYVAYRTNCALTPLLLHAATAGTACWLATG